LDFFQIELSWIEIVELLGFAFLRLLINGLLPSNLVTVEVKVVLILAVALLAWIALDFLFLRDFLRWIL
jgi:hypothetical protein